MCLQQVTLLWQIDDIFMQIFSDTLKLLNVPTILSKVWNAIIDYNLVSRVAAPFCSITIETKTKKNSIQN
jgi:hypothetical protein